MMLVFKVIRIRKNPFKGKAGTAGEYSGEYILFDC